MAGTDERRERRSVVDEGWEPLTPSRGSVWPLVLGAVVALVVVPLVVFFVSYLLASR